MKTFVENRWVNGEMVCPWYGHEMRIAQEHKERGFYMYHEGEEYACGVCGELFVFSKKPRK